jgi:hypothetical protein
MLGPDTTLKPRKAGGRKLEISTAFSRMYWTWNDSPGATECWGTTVLNFTWPEANEKEKDKRIRNNLDRHGVIII